MTALICASLNSVVPLQVFEILLEKGADPNACDWLGNTALINLCKKPSNKGKFDVLLQHKASVNHRNKFGETALLVAAQNNLPVGAIEALCDSDDADVNIADSEGKTAIEHLRARKATSDKFYHVVVRGADITQVPTNKFESLEKSVLNIRRKEVLKFFMVYYQATPSCANGKFVKIMNGPSRHITEYI